MQIRSMSDRFMGWRPLVARLLIGLTGVGIIVSAISLLEFNPPRLPGAPLSRIAPGVSGIGFFNGSCGERDDKHGYSYRFKRSEVRCIFAELHTPADMPEAALDVIFYNANGETMYEENLMIGKESSSTIAGVREGWDEPGHWQPGIYRVEFLVDGELFAVDTFQISD